MIRNNIGLVRISVGHLPMRSLEQLLGTARKGCSLQLDSLENNTFIPCTVQSIELSEDDQVVAKLRVEESHRRTTFRLSERALTQGDIIDIRLSSQPGVGLYKLESLAVQTE